MNELYKYASGAAALIALIYFMFIILVTYADA